MRPSDKVVAALVGSGNIATDLLVKLMQSPVIEPRWMVGIDPDSDGLRRARALGIETSHKGVDWLLSQSDGPDVVFEATSAAVHLANAPRYEKEGIVAIDLTPAAVGPAVVPTVNLAGHFEAPNVSLVTCGGQATIPIVHAVARTTPVSYAEIVSTVASRSAGPGTRANIDEFTKTTARGLEWIGGADRGKAIIILNPAEPPLIMRNTVFCSISAEADFWQVSESISNMVAAVQAYVPGYRLRSDPQLDEPAPGQLRVSVFLEVEGAADYLPAYAGNLDIMTAAATRVGEEVARHLLKGAI